jgi:hypothetical protein
MKALILIPLLLAVGCWEDNRPAVWDRTRNVLGPIPLKSQVAYVDSALDRITLLDLVDDKPKLSTMSIGRNAQFAIPSPDRMRLFVITRGEEAIHEGMIDQRPLLWMLDTLHPESPAVAYEIKSPFDRLSIAPDNSIAVAYFSGSGPDAFGFFRNPNELAVIDLTRPPGPDNPVLKTIRSFGAVPEGIVLSPPMVIPGAEDLTPRTFAFILATNNLTVLDTTHATRSEISIRLDTAGTKVLPREVVFAPNTASAYVRSDNARDVLELSLLAEPPATDGGNDYRPLLSELGAGGGPTDIAVYDDPTNRRYLLASTPNTGEVVVIDADTAQFRSIRISDPIDRVLLFPSGPGVTPHKALLAAIGSKLNRLWVLDLDHIEDPLTQARLDRIDLDKPVRDVVPVPGRDLAMIVHDDARTVLGLLDMDTLSTAPLLGVGKLDSYDFTPEGTHLIGVTSNVARVGFVALDNLHPSDFRLDDRPAKVLAANGKIFVDHGDPRGHATIIPSPDSTRDQAIVLEGFLLNDVLDQEP